jgi:ribosomal protein S3
MGQKVNPIVFRIGFKQNEWKLKYFGKNKEESSYFLYQNLEIKKYLNIIFGFYGLIINDCFIERSELKLHISVDFFITSKFSKKFIKSRRSLRFKKIFFKIMLNNSDFKKKILDTIRKFTNIPKISIEFNDIQRIKYKKRNKSLLLKLKSFNGSTNLSKKKVKKVNTLIYTVIKKLGVYSRENFFQEAINIFIMITLNNASATLLAKFIIIQMQSMKRHNRFLLFLKRIVVNFNKIPLSRINGIKIIIKGRFNGAPRSRNRIIQSGQVPLQKIDSNISYCNTKAFTIYGTFGIKVWVCQK